MYELEARIAMPKWYGPEWYTFEDSAIRLAGYLAAELRREWGRASAIDLNQES